MYASERAIGGESPIPRYPSRFAVRECACAGARPRARSSGTRILVEGISGGVVASCAPVNKRGRDFLLFFKPARELTSASVNRVIIKINTHTRLRYYIRVPTGQRSSTLDSLSGRYIKRAPKKKYSMTEHEETTA